MKQVCYLAYSLIFGIYTQDLKNLHAIVLSVFVFCLLTFSWFNPR